MRNEDHEELLSRLTNITQDIRFAKTQQWRTLYYSLILFAALIAISLNYSPIDSNLKPFLYVIASIACVIAIYYQVSITDRLILYRKHVKVITNLLGSGIAKKIEKESGRENPKTKKHNNELIYFYTIPFILLILLGAIALFIVLCLDLG